MTRARKVLVATLAVWSLAVACETTSGTRSDTPRASSETPRTGRDERILIAAGDIACTPSDEPTPTTCHHEATARLIDRASRDEDLIGVVLLGDIQYEHGAAAEYASFDATWGAAIRSADVPVLPAVGNHEYLDDGPAPPACRLGGGDHHACGTWAYFGPAAFTGAVDDGHGSYVRVFGRRHPHPLVIVVLDTGRCEADPAACAESGPVPTFLEAALTDPAIAPPDACTVVAWHQARWSDYGHGDLPFIDPVWRALFVGGPSRPDLVLNGHDHLYARMQDVDAGGGTAPGGITQIIAGAGGREVAGIPFAGDPPGRTAFADPGRFGVLRVGWDGTAGELTTAFVTEDGERVDPQRFGCR